jgi:3-oxoacyl-(acyl-carrier-protein) synthase
MVEVAITGFGLISPLGNSEPELVESLLGMRSGIRAFESPQLSRAFPVAAVDGEFSAGFNRVELPFLDRTTQMALLAARQASDRAGVVDYAGFGERAGVFHGTVRGGGSTEWEGLRQFYVEARKTAKPYVIMGCMANAAAAQISIRQHIFGPSACHSSACSSSGAAIADACRHIRGGEIDIALAGGAEAALAAPFLAGWDGLRALAELDADPARSCRPFSSRRSGLVLGEGAVFFVLESLAHARARGAEVLGIIEGWGIASDAFHIGSPHQRGQVAALRGALREVGVEGLDYVNAHATATRGGDPVEAAALQEVLGAHAVPVSSTKAQHGHMLGAASAMEALVCLLAMRHSFIPATAFLDADVDPECAGLDHVTAPRRGRRLRRALSLSAGFGGSNVALLLRNADA